MHKKLQEKLKLIYSRFKELQKQLDEIDKFAGKGRVHERFNNLTGSEIREKIAKEKHGKY